MRRRITVGGRVQGVGFRPFVARLAGELGLDGLVGNDVHGAFIEVQGAVERLDEFQRRLEAEAPPLARLGAIVQSEIAACDAAGFSIVGSADGAAPTLAITPDAAICAACAREIADPRDRRFGHPFANCTGCGPRYSIITAVPYDRPNTTMAGFTMCPACRAEYEDPHDRRFHAQPIACPQCGPRLGAPSSSSAGAMDRNALAQAMDRNAPAQAMDRNAPAGAMDRIAPAELELGAPGCIAEAARMLHAGRIVAIKGLGGFHLAVRADDEAAVARLRLRKQRDAKPFAVMVRDLATARSLAALTPDDEARLQSSAAPIVLAPSRGTLAASVAPGSDLLGLMLPYTALHLLLLQAAPPVLVMTSGNPAGEPLCRDNAEAQERLAGIADAFLLHDRDIARPLDDSVWLGATPLRRARGYVPDPIALATARPLLALGGDLKAVVGLAGDGCCVLSEHLGDLANPVAFRNWLAATARLQELLRIRPEAVVVDLHPAYHSVRHGRALGLPVIAVQHHHAHAAACLAEHAHAGPALAVVCDGTGYGSDGTVWGGEVLRLDGAGCERIAHLAPFPLLGGDSGAEDTWRPALGLLYQAYGADWPAHLPRPLDAECIAVAQARLPRAVACSSLGRLFDGVAWLLGLCDVNRFEGEAAIAVERAASSGSAGFSLPFSALDPSPFIRAICERRAAPAVFCHAFHESVCDAFAAAVLRRPEESVALSGGCFANWLLLHGLQRRLGTAGRRVLTHRLVPPGDGGLALGQAWVAGRAESM
jgi:hydrogenase maturation protein HypF